MRHATWLTVVVPAAVLAAGSRPSTQDTEQALSHLLPEYVAAQEAHVANIDPAVPAGVTLTVVSSSIVDHSAITRPDREGPIVACALWVGERPASEHSAEPVCDARVSQVTVVGSMTVDVVEPQ